MDRVGGAGRDQAHVGDRARGPGVALVDRVAVLVEQQAAVEVRARARPAPCRRPSTSPLWKTVLPFVDAPRARPTRRTRRRCRPGRSGRPCACAPRPRRAPTRRAGAPRRPCRAAPIIGATSRSTVCDAPRLPPSSPTAKVLASRGSPPLGRAASRTPAPGSSPGTRPKTSTLTTPSFRNSCVIFSCSWSSFTNGSAVLAAGKRCELTLPSCADRVVRGDERHVAVGALLRLRRVVERARALARHARGLPVVVVVEAAEPAVVVDRHVEVHLVARRAEVRGLLAVEGLEEDLAVRLRVELQQVVVGPRQHRVLAHGEVVQRRVLDLEVALAHRAAHVHDRVAGGAAEAVLRLGRVDLLLDRPVEAAVEEDRVVVAARAPLAAASCRRRPACTRSTSGTTGC